MKTKNILELLDTMAPFAIAENWDNSGLQAGNLNWEVKKIMIGLDVTLSLMMAAKKDNCDLVITHHPLMIQPEKSMDFNKMPGSAIEIAARQKIGIISLHTNLDKARHGLNDYFASKIGLKNTEIFAADSPLSRGINEITGITGIGRIGDLSFGLPFKKLVQKVKQDLDLTHLRVTGDMDLPVERIAVCTGSGGSLLDLFLKSSADVYITGDIKYHEARRVEEHSKALIDVGHFASEIMAIDLLSDKLTQVIKKEKLNIEIKKFKKEKDPFTLV